MNPERPKGLKMAPQLIFLMLAAGIIAISYFSYHNYERTFRAEAEDQLMAVAELKVSELLRWRRERLGDGRELYDNPIFSILVQRYLEESDDLEAVRLLEAWMDKIHEQYSYAQVILVDSAGVLRLTIPRGVTVNPDLEQDLAQDLSAEQVSILDFHRHRPDSPVHLAIMVPIFDDRGDRRRLGLVILSIDPYQYLYPFIARWPTTSQTAETLIIRREGNEAVYLNELRFEKNTAINLRVPLDNNDLPVVMVALGKEGIVEGIDYRGMPVLAALRYVPGSPWALVAKRDIGEVFGPLRERLWMTVLLTVSLLVGAGAGTGLLWRQQHLQFYREQSRTVEMLRESEQRLREAQDLAQLGYWKWDVRSGVVEWSREVFTIFHQDPGTFTPQIDSILALSPWPGEKERNQELIRRATVSREKGDYEQRFLRPGGSIGYYHSTFQGNYNDEGTLVTIVGTVMDITSRKKAEAVQERLLVRAEAARQSLLSMIEDQKLTEEALRESEERYRTLFETMDEGYCVIELINDANGKVVDCRHVEINPAFIAQTGLSDALSRTMREMIPNLEEFWFETYAKVARTGKAIRFEHETIELQKYFSVFAHRIGEEGSRRVGVIFTDISERKRTEKVMLEQLDELSRWHEAMVGRESRVVEIKREVNELLVRLGEPPRYASAMEKGQQGAG